MGCGASNEPAKPPTPPVVCQGKFATYGYAKDAVALSTKKNRLNDIKVNCGSIYVTPHVDTKVDCLVFYPDPRIIEDVAAGESLVPKRVSQDPHRPQWEKGARVQIKEFDSVDDVYKDWFESPSAGDRNHRGLPGVHMLEDAGPMGAWVSFSPNSYQTRFVLPNGRRMWSPIADAGQQHISVPQRIHRVYKKLGEPGLTSLCDRLSRALKNLQAKLEALGTPSFLTDLIFDPTETVRELMKEFDKMGEYHTVYEFPPVLHPLRDILSEIEDNLIYNWFEVAIDCDLQLGAYKFSRRKKDMSHDRTLLDKALWWCLEHLNEGTDYALDTIREEVRDMTKKVVDRWIKPSKKVKGGGNKKSANEDDMAVESVASSSVVTPSPSGDDVEGGKGPAKEEIGDGDDDEDDDGIDHSPDPEGDNIINCFFPDFSELVEAVIAVIDGEVHGLVEELDENRGRALEGCDDVRGLIEKWRAEDDRPIEEKRQEFYDGKIKSLQRTLMDFRKCTDPDQLTADQRRKLDRMSRVPLILPKHFYEFTFYLVFPKWDKEEVESMKCPSKALLNLWPEGTTAEGNSTQQVEMTPFDLPNGGPDSITSTAQSFANKLFNSGDSSIDSDDEDDPRNKWSPYPSTEFRGYQCTVTCATNLTYNFHFVLDDLIFLDHDSWSKDPSGESGECRRIRFTDRTRPFTVNPLKHTGLVM